MFRLQIIQVRLVSRCRSDAAFLPAPPAVAPAAAVPTFADNPGQARIQAEREAAAAAAVTPTSPITPVTPVTPTTRRVTDEGERQPKKRQYGLLMNVKMPVMLSQSHAADKTHDQPSTPYWLHTVWKD
jgi:hypothetical protein